MARVILRKASLTVKSAELAPFSLSTQLVKELPRTPHMWGRVAGRIAVRPNGVRAANRPGGGLAAPWT
jgi:hypothetical protein